jgi:hypothetical protein
LDRNQHGAQFDVEAGLFGKPLLDQVDFRQRLRRRRARPQPCDGPIIVIPDRSHLRLRHDQWHEYFRRLRQDRARQHPPAERQAERSRQDAHNRERAAVERHHISHHSQIGFEFSAPQRFGNQHYLVFARLLFVGHESAALHGHDAE